jgi:quinol monooxygenase YgiN
LEGRSAISDAGVDLTVMLGIFDAAPGRETDLGGVLARYVVVSRAEEGCRNIDLVASLIVPGRLVVYEKWESAEAQATHMSGANMTEMAEGVSPLLSGPPDLGLFVAVSAHDLL